MDGNKSEASKYRTHAINSRKALLKVTCNVAQHRAESYRLSGTYYWLINKRKRALKWWEKAIGKAERLGARLELSRIYFEVGRRFLEADNKRQMLKGLDAKGYLQKARLLFEEMSLQRELDELNRIKKP